jgi:hypothetical protein
MKVPWPSGIRMILLHPAGPFTIFFWAPTVKNLISVANIGDLEKPPEFISTNQQFVIAISGLIWTRYSFVCTPKNCNLGIGNLFMSMTGFYQLYRKT